MFLGEPEGLYCQRLCTTTAHFWFSLEHLWATSMPFWLSTSYTVTCLAIDLMHWRHISITTRPCWGSRLVALRARAVLAERWLSVGARARAGPAVWHAGVGPLAVCLAMAHVTVPRLTPNHVGAPFCDVICTRSIPLISNLSCITVNSSPPQFSHT